MSWTLLKIPLALATAFYASSLLVPPQPRPRTHEQDRYQGLRVFGRSVDGQSVNIIIPVARHMFTIIGCIDAMFTFAYEYRSTPFGANILSFICAEPAMAHPTISPIYMLTTAVVILSSYVRGCCYRELGKYFTFELSIHDDHKLVTTGPYAIVRHPSYTAAMSLAVGLTVWGVLPGSWLAEAGILKTGAGKVFSGIWILVLASVMTWIARAWREDAALQNAFGKEWEAYAQRVPYRFIPWIL